MRSEPEVDRVSRRGTQPCGGIHDRESKSDAWGKSPEVIRNDYRREEWEFVSVRLQSHPSPTVFTDFLTRPMLEMGPSSMDRRPTSDTDNIPSFPPEKGADLAQGSQP